MTDYRSCVEENWHRWDCPDCGQVFVHECQPAPRTVRTGFGMSASASASVDAQNIENWLADD